MDTAPGREPAAPHEVWHRPFVQQHQRWCDEFVLELRLRDVAGAVIGDRLGEVETHCAETGESPAEAFGDPTAYAEHLDEQATPQRVSGPWRVAVIAAAKVLALIVGTSAATPWERDEQLSYNVAQLGGLVLVVVVLLSLPLLMRRLVQRPWSVGLPLLGLGILGSVSSVAAGRLDLPAVLDVPASTVTVGLFLVVLVLSWIEYRELSRDVDGGRVTSPLAPATEARPRQHRWVVLLPSLLVPIAYVVLSALPWLA